MNISLVTNVQFLRPKARSLNLLMFTTGPIGKTNCPAFWTYSKTKSKPFKLYFAVFYSP